MSLATFFIMLFVFYIKGFFKEGRFYSYHERIGRLVFFKNFILYLICFFLTAVMFLTIFSGLFFSSNGLLIFAVMGTIVFAPFNIFLAVLIIKRLHDLNISGKILIAYIVCLPIINFILSKIPEIYLAGTLGYVIAIIHIIIQLGFFIALFFVKGTNGPNKYGENPLLIKTDKQSTE